MEYKWYIVQVLSGGEEQVMRSIFELSERFGVSADFEEVFIPYEESVAIRRNKKHIVKTRLCPGYVFVKMRMHEDSMRFVKNIAKVSSFLSEFNSPKVIPDADVEAMKSKVSESSITEDKLKCSLDVGDTVKINGGPFQYLSGKIDSINDDKGMAKILITMFGRTTKVELELNHIEKLEEGCE